MIFSICINSLKFLLFPDFDDEHWYWANIKNLRISIPIKPDPKIVPEKFKIDFFSSLAMKKIRKIDFYFFSHASLFHKWIYILRALLHAHFEPRHQMLLVLIHRELFYLLCLFLQWDCVSMCAPWDHK